VGPCRRRDRVVGRGQPSIPTLAGWEQRAPTPGPRMGTNGSTFRTTLATPSSLDPRPIGQHCHIERPNLVHDQDARDQIDWNPEWSRRARGFATYAAIHQMGRSGIAAMIDRCCQHAATIIAGIGQLPGAEVLWRSQINQGLVRFLDRRAGATDLDHDRLTDAVIQSILKDGDVFFMGTTWRERRAMRVSVLNWQTSDSDVARAVAAVSRCLAAEQAGVDAPLKRSFGE